MKEKEDKKNKAQHESNEKEKAKDVKKELNKFYFFDFLLLRSFLVVAPDLHFISSILQLQVRSPTVFLCSILIILLVQAHLIQGRNSIYIFFN